MRKKWARSDGAAAEVFVGIAARELGVGERERGAKSAPSVREREMKSERVREGAWDQKAAVFARPTSSFHPRISKRPGITCVRE